jgi:pantoate--beta-alanine ligase
MKVIRDIEGMRAWSREARGGGKKLVFVPTMGALHEGHLSLMREGLKRADALAISIYVNPAQFGAGEDLNEYPNSIEEDLRKAEELGTDAVFLPTDEAIYPEGYQTFVTVEGITESLCGARRPGHFRGVTTVVAKLLNIVSPDLAVFGEKDFQQLVAIRRMVADLEIPVEIVGAPIVREPDGLAMSSRNSYLSPAQREAATSLFKSLCAAEQLIATGKTDAQAILRSVRETIGSHEEMRIDYARLVDAETLEDLNEFRRPALLAIAAFAGTTRLIDNRCFR